MAISFTKMHHLGNDFVVIAAVSSLDFTPSRIQFIADRYFGIGCDQLLVLEKTRSRDTDFYCRIFNPDGEEVGMCGNGLLCLAYLIHAQKLTLESTFTITTMARTVTATIADDESITVAMGLPEFAPSLIPLLAPSQDATYDLRTTTGENFVVGAVSMGNPHIVLRFDDIETVDVERIGALLVRHPLFPQGANVNFMQVLGRDSIKLRTYERCVGETLACGSGSCAAVAVGRLWQELDNEVIVSLQRGHLMVKCHTLNSPLLLVGRAVVVFSGELVI